MKHEQDKQTTVSSGSLPQAFRFKGHSYDLWHLRAYDAIYERQAEFDKPAVRFQVAVSFSHHCFTKGIEVTDGLSDDQLFTHAGEVRLFSVQRWNLSLQLPAIVAELATRECLHANNSNFVTIAMTDDAGNEREYEVYFRVRKTGRGRLWLNIESAYVRDPARLASRPRGKRVRFLVILYNVLHGKPLRG
jgi:hypothetical protein